MREEKFRKNIRRKDECKLMGKDRERLRKAREKILQGGNNKNLKTDGK